MNNTGQIIKSKTANYTVIPNETAKNNNLSLEARGLLLYLISLPDDWVLYKSNLHEHLNEKKAKVDRAFRELKENGYLASVRMVGESGKFVGWNHVVYSISINEEQPTLSFTEVGENRKSEKPKVGFTDNRKNYAYTKERLNTKERIIQKKEKDTPIYKIKIEDVIPENYNKYQRIAIKFFWLFANYEKNKTFKDDISVVAKKAKLEAWTKEVKSLMESKGYTAQDFYKVFRYLPKDDFWMNTISSISALNKIDKNGNLRFATILIKANDWMMKPK